ncbi:Tax1-binding protein 1 [Saguinus oedipus]|uniref:Tax1-binding protein 1 n=1 Tax=Saguinus oedipus TaxID=9490 RepID=A0ABQ9UHA6_SAGOE|nr:Tax1-binding protein 1 [Saguinus oedipus]
MLWPRPKQLRWRPDEKTKCNKYADELAKMELKWKEQVKIAENVKLELAEVQDNYKLQLAEKDKEISGLTSHLENLSREKETSLKFNDLQHNLTFTECYICNENYEPLELTRSLENQAERKMEGQNSQSPQCFNTCSEQNDYILTLSNAQPVLQYDGADGAFYPDEIQRPPVRVPSWGLEDNVVCSQPARNLSRPDGLEDPEDSKVN